MLGLKSLLNPATLLAVLITLAVPNVAWTQPCSCIDMAEPTDASKLIMEMHGHSHFGGSSGWRVLANGEYSSLKCDKRTHECSWKLYRKLSEDEMSKLTAGLAKIDLAGLKDEYKPEKRVMDGGSYTYWFSLDGKIKKVNYKQGAKAPELDAAEKALTDCLYWPTITGAWTIFKDGKEETYDQPCSPSDIKDVGAVTWAMAGKGKKVEGVKPKGKMVFRLVWLADGKEEARQEWYSDGFEVYTSPIDTDSIEQYNEEEAKAVMDAFNKVDWKTVKDRCPPKKK